MDARKRTHMASVLEYVEWFILICLMVVVGFEYLIITMLMQQIDEINERLIRLLNDEPQSKSLERIRGWRQDPKLRWKL